MYWLLSTELTDQYQLTLICAHLQTAAWLIKMRRTRLKPPHAQTNTMRRPGRRWKAGHGFSEGPFGLGCPLSFYLSPISPAHVISLLSWILSGFFHQEVRDCGYCPQGERLRCRNWTLKSELEQPAGVSLSQWSLIHNPTVVRLHYSHSRNAVGHWSRNMVPSCIEKIEKNGSIKYTSCIALMQAVKLRLK